VLKHGGVNILFHLNEAGCAVVSALVIINADEISDGGGGADAEHGAGYALVDAGCDLAEFFHARGTIDASLLVDGLNGSVVRVEVGIGVGVDGDSVIVVSTYRVGAVSLSTDQPVMAPESSLAWITFFVSVRVWWRNASTFSGATLR